MKCSSTSVATAELLAHWRYCGATAGGSSAGTLSPFPSGVPHTAGIAPSTSLAAGGESAVVSQEPSSKFIEPIAASFWGDEETSLPKRTRRRDQEEVAAASTVGRQLKRQLKVVAKRERERSVLEKKREGERKQAQLERNQQERARRLAAESRRVTLQREWEMHAKRQEKVEKKVLSSINKMALREQHEMEKKRRIESESQYADQRAQEVREKEEFAEWQRQASVKLYRERERKERDLCEQLVSQRLANEKREDGFGTEEVPVPVTTRPSVLRRKSEIAIETCNVSHEAAPPEGGERRSKAAPYDGDARAFEVTPDDIEALPVVPSEWDTWESALAGDSWTAAASQQRAAAAEEAKAWRVEMNSKHATARGGCGCRLPGASDGI